MKFKTKPIEIEAWRYDCGEPMPDILVKALETNILRIPVDDGEGFLVGRVYNKIHSAWLFYARNDWLIYSNVPDAIYPCTDEQFQKKYERI